MSIAAFRPGADFLRSTAGRMFLVLLVGMALASTLAASISESRRRGDIERLYEGRSSDHVQEYVGWLNEGAQPSTMPPRQRRSSARLTTVKPQLGKPDREFQHLLSARLGDRSQVQAWRVDHNYCRLARFGAKAQPYGEDTRPPKCWFVKVRLNSGADATLFVDTPPRIDPGSNLPDPLLIVALGLCAAVLAFYVASTSAAPLRRLARAATELGGNLDRPPLPEKGPTEVAAAARAFNAMQRQIRKHLQDRTQMLAAITHDLQTPATRLRLRLEKVADPELREKLIGDLAAMQALIREGLSLARSADEGAAPMISLDLDSLVESLVADEADAGRAAAFAGGCGCDVKAQPEALRRAISNLIDNALIYGGRAEVTAHRSGDQAVIRIRDAGPGIAEQKLEAVFDPFVRIETSRSRETGGAGLGLTIARALIERNGGTVVLENLEGGGLVAIVTLPISGSAAAAA